MPLFHGNAIPSATGYDIANSLRFNAPDSSYTSFTPSSNGNRRTWTWSGWIKRGCTGSTRGGKLAYQGVFMAGATNDESHIKLFINDKIDIDNYTSGTHNFHLKTTAVYSDVSNWYHICVAFDTTQGTASNRIKLYINGTRVTAFDQEDYPAQNYDTAWNSTSHPMMHGRDGSNTQRFDGYMAEIHYIDGTAYAPTAFGEVDEDYGHWKPIKPDVTYGTNGFHLDFENSSSLGNDANGSNNSSVTNFATSDQTLDTPTNNFAVINSREDVYPPSDDSATTIQQGNLQVTNTANAAACMRRATFGMDSGKWYWEVLRNVTSGSESGTTLGIMPSAAGWGRTTNYIGGQHPNVQGGIGFYGSGSGSGVAHGGTINNSVGAQTTANNVIGMAYDCATGKFWVSIDGTWTGGSNPSTGNNPNFTFTDAVITKSPAFQYHNYVEYIANFGQEGTFTGRKTAGGNSDDNGYGNFLYDVPAGFLSLCSKNLPEPAVKPKEHFKTVLYSGNGSTNAVTGTGFTPGLTWIKARNSSNYNAESYDIARGATYSQALASNGVEYQHGNTLASFDSNGFTLGAHAGINNNGTTFASWNWKMGGSPSSNSNGSITTNVSANQSAGQSVLTYTGTGTTATLGHGLSDTPDLILLKVRNFSASGQGWVVGTDSQEAKILHSGTFNMTDTGNLDGTSAWYDETVWMDGANLSNTTFSVEGGHPRCNVNTYNYLAYCFHNVEGYQKIGGYDSGAGGAENGVGGAISGTFVYTGFRPAFVYIKAFDHAGNEWVTVDSTRYPDNGLHGNDSRQVLYLSAVNTETQGEAISIDFYSNGFKCMERDSWFNDYRYCYFYYAVAEYPFKYSNAG